MFFKSNAKTSFYKKNNHYSNRAFRAWVCMPADYAMLYDLSDNI